jgi:hypothetical protein
MQSAAMPITELQMMSVNSHNETGIPLLVTQMQKMNLSHWKYFQSFGKSVDMTAMF